MLLSIDPGTTQSAIVCWDNSAGRIAYSEMMENGDLLEHLRGQVIASDVFVEKLACYGMPVGSEIFDTAYMIGRIQEICSVRQVKLTLVTRLSVKMHLCHTPQAKDSNIRQALIDRLGPVGTKKNQGACYGISGDLWSALAIAVYAHDTQVGVAHGSE